MQQWATIVLNTMPDIPTDNLIAMVNDFAVAFRKEMDRQNLDFRPYPEFCTYMNFMVCFAKDIANVV